MKRHRITGFMTKRRIRIIEKREEGKIICNLLCIDNFGKKIFILNSVSKIKKRDLNGPVFKKCRYI